MLTGFEGVVMRLEMDLTNTIETPDKVLMLNPFELQDSKHKVNERIN